MIALTISKHVSRTTLKSSVSAVNAFLVGKVGIAKLQFVTQFATPDLVLESTLAYVILDGLVHHATKLYAQIVNMEYAWLLKNAHVFMVGKEATALLLFIKAGA